MATRTPMPRINRRGRYVIGLLAAVIALLTLGGWLVGLYTEYLWYQSVDYAGVFKTMLWSRVGLFAGVGALMAVWVAANLYVAFKFRPDTVPHTPEQQSMERYRSVIEPKVGLWIAGAAVLVGIFGGVSASGRWQEWLLFSNAKDFGHKDPVFNMDAGFYVFKLPFYEYLVGLGFALVVVGVIAAMGAHYLYGALRMSGRGDRITAAARWHLSILIGLFILLKGVAYYLDRFALTLEENHIGLTGGGHTEISALLPAKEILIFVTVLAAVAVVVFSNAFARTLVVPGMAIGLVVVSAIALGGVYPMVVREVSVSPNVPDKEGQYVQNTIDGTMYAFDVGDIDENTYSYGASPNADPNQLTSEDNKAATVDYTRLMDPAIVSDAFTQKQQARGFHAFNEKLDVDRYTDEDGNTQDYVVGVRELDLDRFEDADDWVISHNVYTHGYGFVGAPTNQVCQDGPFFESGSLLDLEETDESELEDIEGDEGQIGEGDTEEESETCRSNSDFVEIDRPQIYYGELNDDYAIVGSPEGESPREYDRPAGGTTTDEGEEAEGEDEQVEGEDVYVTYEGSGGVDVSGFFNRLWYGWEFGEVNFLLSDQFNENSKLLYDRSPRERVQKVAPFLTADADPYPTVIDGKIKWVVDAYTTTDSFPYSNQVDLQEATNDSYTGAGTAQQPSESINYMRNSVKAVVDAYDGSVDLYRFGEPDPMLEVWNEAFGGVVKPESEMPEDLVDHLRYPNDQFKVQRDLLERFHVTDARTFIDGSEYWDSPEDPTQDGVNLSPYYVLAQFPEQEQPNFQLTSTFTPRERDNVLSGMMTGHYEEVEEDGETVLRPSLSMYELTSTNIVSTHQVHQDITSTPEVTERLKLYDQPGTEVVWGNLLALPVGDGVMYVEPMYLKRQGSEGGAALPLLRHVAVAYGGHIAFEDSFQESVAAVVAQYTGSGDEEPDEGEGDQEGEEGEGEDQAEVSPEMQEALDDIDKAVVALDKAMQDGDMAAYGEALQQLSDAMDKYEKAKE
ncbi:MAG: UPF0182 family protein [Stackebrandtia sp.]